MNDGHALGRLRATQVHRVVEQRKSLRHQPWCPVAEDDALGELRHGVEVTRLGRAGEFVDRIVVATHGIEFARTPHCH